MMIRNKMKVLCLMAMAAVALTGCDLLEEQDEEEDDDIEMPSVEVVKGEMRDLVLSGVVSDTDGQPVEGVTVTTGESVALTTSSGLFTLSRVDVVAGRSVVRFSKPGYFDVVRSVKSVDDDAWDVVICPKKNGGFSSVATYDAYKATTLKAGNMQVDMPQDGYVTDATGRVYSGQVNAQMLYLDPNNEYFADMMPGGDLAAVRTDGSEAQLVSYGMTAVSLTDQAGNKLQLRKGARATLTFPIPEGMAANLPDAIPLWSFNESNGLWEEEGQATLDGDHYVGQVSHFSWVNLDYPEEQATVEGYVRDKSGRAVGGLPIHVGQVTTRTDSRGYYRQDVMANEDFDIVVRAEDYSYSRDPFRLTVKALAPRTTHRVDITLPTQPRVSGRIVNTAGGLSIASVWIGYGSRRTTTQTSKIDGTFTTYAPETYRGPATLYVQTIDGDIITRELTLNGTDINVGDIEITTLTASGGQATVQLSDGSTVTLNIVNPADLGNAMSGIVVTDNQLQSITDDEEGASTQQFMLQIGDYSPDRTDYESVQIFIADGNHQVMCPGANVTVSRRQQKFVFDFGGTCSYYNESNGTYDPAAVIAATGVTIDLLMVQRTYRNIDPFSVGAPTFTPTLGSKAPLVSAITESKYGTGTIVYYNGTKSDYQLLKDQAGKSGIRKVEEYNGSNEAEITFFSDQRLIQLEYDSEGRTVDDSFDFNDDGPQIYVLAMEGVPDSFLNVIAGSRRPRRAALARTALRRQ